ncbi:ejaculatory bulb-specific protein 3 precursor, putative [Pediculus humanus corporis]|uniref:Ejaculatory bulb-specific protein 3, putative n=1 Tax=Pediculus humanus subsp. corporis TaxID=121224 RepID=E0W2J8_PEDHC|nr:ejaculatory bulb-specific protein 3 precursor, putative [Pediculus humanus corporis]EEB19854.1 ejaculatory bulb-specific protein 3 precursor, putative [Pediculus humanus corporis]
MIYKAEKFGEKYTTRWDNIDVDEILSSERLLGNYKKCLMDQGPCTPDGKELKKNLPDALKNDCSKCSEKQKINMHKVIDFFKDNKTEWWAELQKKYDPEGIYLKNHIANNRHGDKNDDKRDDDKKKEERDEMEKNDNKENSR